MLRIKVKRNGYLTLSTLAADLDEGGRALLKAACGIPCFERLVSDPTTPVPLTVNDLTKLDTSVRNRINGRPVPPFVWATVRARTRDALDEPDEPMSLEIVWNGTAGPANDSSRHRDE